MFISLFRKLILFFLCILFANSHLFAGNENLSLDLNNANLHDAIRLIAQFLKVNVIISPTVSGMVTLHLHHAAKSEALLLLLKSQGLVGWRSGNVWYISRAEDLIKQQQEELKWQEMKEETASLNTFILQIKYAKAEEIAEVLNGEHSPFLSKRGRVNVDTRTNTICIHDVKERIANINRVIQHLDVPIKQIEVYARLASVDYDCERELGFSFTSLNTNAYQDDLTPTQQLHFAPSHYSLALVKLADDSLLDVKLAALENAGHAELISSPRLFTSNQQAASIEAGEDVPYQEVSESGGTAVAFKKAVLGLKVTPQIFPGNKVLLQLQINQDRPSNKTVQGVPTISTRQIITSVLLKNGQTIVLGGIYETNKENGEERIPFISRVPLLGLLFKVQHRRETKRELLIFVTPRIIT